MAEKKTVLITGANRGIGKAIALRLSANCNLVLTARNKEMLSAVQKECEANGATVYAETADIGNQKEIESLIQNALNRSRIDVLINNAGFGTFHRVDEFPVDEFQEILNVNVVAPFLFTRAVIPTMIERKQGQIINISSVAGLNGFKSGTAYAASKHALNGFTESLREDVKDFGIAVTAVCPGGVRTEFGGNDPEKMNRDFLLEADDVARTVEYLVHESETANAKLIELKPRKHPAKR